MIWRLSSEPPISANPRENVYLKKNINWLG